MILMFLVSKLELLNPPADTTTNMLSGRSLIEITEYMKTIPNLAKNWNIKNLISKRKISLFINNIIVL